MALGSTKPTFFSLFAYNDDMEGDNCNPEWKRTIFRQMSTNGTISWTPFYSIVDPKLVNPVRIESLALVYYTTFAQSSSLREPFHTKKLTGNDAASLAMCLLVALHNKQQAADAAIISRYILVNGFVSWPMWPNPGVLLEKLKACNRSRFAVHINKLLMEACRAVSRKPYVQDESDDARWHNMFNWITGDPINSPSDLVNSFYYCYAIGKCKTIETNYLGQLVESVTNWEDKLPESCVGLGHGNKNPEDRST